MKRLAVMTAILVGGLSVVVSMANAQHADHQMTTPADLQWAPLAAITGAQIAVIEGPVDQPGIPFTARIKFPANSKVPPHWHSTTEHATVISGVLNMGVGDKLDTSKTKLLVPAVCQSCSPEPIISLGSARRRFSNSMASAHGPCLMLMPLMTR